MCVLCVYVSASVLELAFARIYTCTKFLFFFFFFLFVVVVVVVPSLIVCVWFVVSVHVCFSTVYLLSVCML